MHIILPALILKIKIAFKRYIFLKIISNLIIPFNEISHTYGLF